MRLINIVFFLCLCQLVYGQNRKLTDDQINKSTAVRMTFADTIRSCELMDKWFEADIKNNTVFIFLQGGIAPTVYQNDTLFENKYRVFFYDFGDIAPKMNCIIRYNENAFNYLTKLHGNKWEKEIRKDVIGLKKWRKNKPKK